MIKIRVEKITKYEVENSYSKEKEEREREETIYTQRVAEDKFDIDAVIKAVNGIA